MVVNISMSQGNANLESIISAINLINTSMSIPIDLPIQKKRVNFRQITTGQEKRLIKDLVVNDKSTLISALLPILKENCEDPSIDVDKLTIVDLYAIVLKIRIYSVGNELTLRIQKKKPKTGSFTTKVSLNDLYEQLMDNIKDFNDLGFVVKMTPYEIRCELPTVKALVESSAEKIETSYDNLFLETARMITSMDIVSDTGEKQTIDLSDMDYESKVKIVSNMPNLVLTKVYQETVKLVKSIRDLLIFDFTFEGDTYRKTVDITSADFFTIF